MTIEEMKTRVAGLKAEVVRIDELTDDENMSGEEFDRLTHKANELAAEYGRL